MKEPPKRPSAADQPTRSKSGSTPPPLPSKTPSRHDHVRVSKPARRSRSGVLVWYSTASAIIVVLIGMAVYVVLSKSPTTDQKAKDQQASSKEQSPKNTQSNESNLSEQRPAAATHDRPKSKTKDDQAQVHANAVPVAKVNPQPDEAPAVEQPVAANDLKPMADDPVPEDPIAQNFGDANREDDTEGADRLIAMAADLMQNIKSKNEKDAMAAFKQAFVTLKKASNLYPKEIRPDFYAGLLHSGIGINDPKTAEFHFRRVLDRQPGHAATMNNLALVEVRARRFAVVKNYFGLMSKLDPVPIETSQNLGRLMANSKLLELKGDDLKKFTALEAQHKGFESSVGWVYMPLNRKAQSLEEYKPFCRDGRLEDPRCIICSGQQSLVCRLCKGSGTQLQSGTMAQSVVGLYGTVTVTTPVTGQAACSGCRGRGRVDCAACQDGRDATIIRSAGDAYQRVFGNRLPDPD